MALKDINIIKKIVLALDFYVVSGTQGPSYIFSPKSLITTYRNILCFIELSCLMQPAQSSAFRSTKQHTVG